MTTHSQDCSMHRQEARYGTYRARVGVNTAEKHIRCAFDIKYHPKKKGTIHFFLYEGLDVDVVRINGKRIPHDEKSKAGPFKPYAKTVVVTNVECSTLNVSYTGRIDGDISAYNNGIYEDFVLLTDYAPWFPFPCDIPTACIESDDVDMEVVVDGVDGYTVVNGQFDDDKNVWIFKGSMLLCVKNHKMETAQADTMKFSMIFYDPEERQAARKYTSLARECMLFYTQRILGRSLPQHDFVFFRPNRPVSRGWAFVRDNVIILGDKLTDDVSVADLIGHELAHFWSTGAGMNWEDWLNESFAEYASMLFVESKYGADAYHERVEQLKTENDKKYRMQPIKPPVGESRPDSVHTKGPIVLDGLRWEFGYDAVCEVIRVFDKLDVKSTDRLLEGIRKDNRGEIADWLGRKISEPL